MNKIQELWEELQQVFAGRGAKVLDALLPAVIFWLTNPSLGIPLALLFSIGTSLLFFTFRVFQKDNLFYAVGGSGAVLLAAIFAYISNTAVGFFLPGLVSSGLTVITLLLSIAIRRPLAAVSSHLTRNWPLAWYWHPQVRPAYSEVTLFWALGFGARLGLEYWLFQQGEAGLLGVIRTVLGWPYTILLLILSYLYGLRRLNQLEGPSVNEYKSGKDAPWDGQKRGF